MDIDLYAELAQRTRGSANAADQIMNGCLGLAGECGECCDILKKALFQGHELDVEHLIEELGDVLWYVAETAAGLSIPLSEIARRNIEKLKIRYPDGFDPNRSIHRGSNSEQN